MARPPWMVYERNAARWAVDRAPGLSIERHWLARFVDLLGPGSTVLDLGCGHGQPIGAELLGRGFAVTGVDLAPSLIELARERLPGGRWLVADMAALDLGETFDGLLMWHSLFHLTHDEQRQAISSLGRHAGPGAPLLFTSGPAAGSAQGTYGGEVLHHHSLGPTEYTDLLEATGFELIDHRLRDPDCGDATVWLARHRSRP